MVAHAKPDPDLFLAAALLDIEPRHAYVVGDSVWDLLAHPGPPVVLAPLVLTRSSSCDPIVLAA
jgi:hypothetical protein